MHALRRAVLLFVSLAICLAPLCALAESKFSDDPDRIEVAAKSVLMLEVYDADGVFLGSGSGFVAFDNKKLVTNYHVIEGAAYVIGYSDDGYQYIVDKVLISDARRDLAILGFFSPTDLAPLSLDAASELKRAQTVVAIGSPIGIKNTVSIGNISALYEEDGVSEIQFTAPISPGSSGGALFDDNGNVIGITSATYMDAQNINIAVHAAEVIALFAEWDGVSGTSLAGNATPTPTVAPNPTPTAPVNTYEALKYGDRGAAVRKLQLALIRLGYLNDQADGIFGVNTREAVAAFNLTNGLSVLEGWHYVPDPQIASNETQQLLFDGHPLAYGESGGSLIILDDAYAEWYFLSDDTIQIHFEVTNQSSAKTVESFVLTAYATDAWGNLIYGTGNAYTWTTTASVAPGETIYSDYFILPDRSKISLVFCGVSKVVYTDGTVETVGDADILFGSWNVND